MPASAAYAGSHRSTQARRFRPYLLIAVVTAVAALTAAMPARPAAAIGVGGAEPFGLSVAPGADGIAPAYFTMALADGQSATGYVLISNLAKTTDTLKVTPSAGVTAGNGGAAYNAATPRCSGPGCWVTGLPAVTTLAAGTAERVRFSVRVPRGTPNGQYLAGVTAEPAVRPRSVQVGSNGKATARAIIIEQVTIGVAVTVGALSGLRTGFRIPGVTGKAIGSTLRLNIHLDNTGQTFARATGRASCTAAGQRHSFAVVAGTILPHDGAEIAVNTPGLKAGTTVPCAVLLHYGKGQAVSWAGSVVLPAASRTRLVHTGPGAYSVVPDPGIPLWAWVLGALLLAAIMLAALALLLRWRRVRHHAA